MSPWKVIFATMVIFVCGVVTGALVIKTQGWPRPPFRPGGGPVGVPGPAPVRDFTSQLQSKLGLTLEQHDKIEKIMQDSQATNAAIRKLYAPQLHAEMERAHQAINQVLTPEQQPKFAELLKEREQRTGGRGEGRGGRGGERGGSRSRNPNRASTNAFPEDGRDRMDRRDQSNSLSTNGP